MENEPDTLPAESDPGALPPPPDTPLAEGPTMPDAGSPPPHPDPYPFWGYADLVVFFGLAFPCVLLGAFTVKFFLWVFHIRAHSLALELVPAQFLGYGFLFFALYLLLTVHYQRPFWQSLRWVRTRPEFPEPFCMVLSWRSSWRFGPARGHRHSHAHERPAVRPQRHLIDRHFRGDARPDLRGTGVPRLPATRLVRSFGPVAGVVLAAIPWPAASRNTADRGAMDC
jgi:hypothetical protein